LLGEQLEEGEERYGLNWKGKARARAFALTPSLGTLRPAKADSKDWDNTKNIVIEGDNLEVLKLLRKSYAGKVKLIYIDPPYNTGKDFVYPDNYADSLANYEALTGQRGADGARMTSNKESSGRFHTDWLNMMYPRLMLAKELLRDDGFLFISIDDREIANVISLCNHAFGEYSHIANFVWKRRSGAMDAVSNASEDHEYLVCIANQTPILAGLTRTFDRYSNPDNDLRGDWIADNLSAGKPGGDTLYSIVDPKTGNSFDPPQGRFWPYSRTTMQQKIEEGRVLFPKNSSGTPMLKRFREEAKRDVLPISTWIENQESKNQGTLSVPQNSQATRALKELLGDKIFSFPKPVELIAAAMTASGANEDDLILDFFAGSGTTGHAVMAQNAADGGNRRYILVQLPEPLDPAKAEQKTAADFCDTLGKPRTIAELTKERLRRAGEKVKADNPTAEIDAGFRVYKLATSNLKPWQPTGDLAADLLDAVGNVLPGRGEDDLLVELLLKTGIDLALPATTRAIAGCTVHAFGGGTLLVCLSDIPAAQARALGDGIADWLNELAPIAPTTFFFKDTGFDANASGAGPRSAEARSNLAATLKQRLGDEGIEKLGAI
jgi:adenine-specific DNA-methyltransferase